MLSCSSKCRNFILYCISLSLSLLDKILIALYLIFFSLSPIKLRVISKVIWNSWVVDCSSTFHLAFIDTVPIYFQASFWVILVPICASSWIPSEHSSKFKKVLRSLTTIDSGRIWLSQDFRQNTHFSIILLSNTRFSDHQTPRIYRKP